MEFIIDAIPKIAVFLLLFASVALVFEIFYFRKRGKTETTFPTPGEEQPGQSTTRFKKKTLVIVGVILIALLLPLSVHVVFQRVSLEKEAQTQGTGVTIGCDQVDL